MIINQKDWMDALGAEFEKPYFKELEKFIEEEYNQYTVFPKKEDIFSALNYTALKDVKVLLVGQDPYHDDNQAHGFSFSVPKNQKIPPSLNNIYKELNSDLGLKIPNNGHLIKWAEQGVLLLNTVLTVRAHSPNSHRNKGWERFTDEIIKAINNLDKPLVIFLWGKPAQKKKSLLDNQKHIIIETSHPIPLSSYRGFSGSKCFSKCNDFLAKNNIAEIDWQIENI
jgi:uracil-DNA glycosylase